MSADQRDLLVSWILGETNREESPLGVVLGLGEALDRYGASAGDLSSAAKLTIEYLMPRDDPDFDALAETLALVLASIFEPPGGIVTEVYAHHLSCTSLLEATGATVADSVDLQPQPGEDVVVVDGMLGTLAVRTGLLEMAAETATPVVIFNAGVWQTPTPIETSAYLAQLVTGLQPDVTPIRRSQVASHLINEPAGRPTQAALDRLERTRWNVSGTHSAVAQVLRSRPETSARATELERLIVRWLDLRIFDGSLVTEMALHDQSHALSVDRNVAAIAGALFEQGAIDGDDLFRLGCAAWLHDCGHSSALLTTNGYEGVPAEPGFVRDFHGLLTAVRLEQFPDQFGLRAEDAGWVRLLARHHQGWTSIGAVDDLAAPRTTADDERAYAAWLTTSLGSSLAELGGGAGPLDQEHAVKLISLLRVCDAIDVGRHRIQHEDLHTAQLGNALRIYGQRCIDAIDLGYATRELLSRVRILIAETARLAHTLVEEDLKRNLRLAGLELTKLDPALDHRDRERVKLWTGRLISYCGYVFSQGKHFRKHRLVNTVIPVVHRAADGDGAGAARLELLVLPGSHTIDAGKSQAELDVEAVRGISRDLAKELGVREGDPAGDYSAREPVRRAFQDLGLPLTEDGALAVQVNVPWWWTAYRAGDLVSPLRAEDTPIEGEHEAEAGQPS